MEARDLSRDRAAMLTLELSWGDRDLYGGHLEGQKSSHRCPCRVRLPRQPRRRPRSYVVPHHPIAICDRACALADARERAGRAGVCGHLGLAYCTALLLVPRLSVIAQGPAQGGRTAGVAKTNSLSEPR